MCRHALPFCYQLWTNTFFQNRMYCTVMSKVSTYSSQYQKAAINTLKYMHIILEMLGGKLYQGQQSGIQLQPSVIPRKEGRYEGGAGLGLWHYVILWATPAGHMEKGAECPCELPWPCLCPVRAKECGHSTGMSNTLSEGAEVTGFILIWKCGPRCLL